MNLVKTGQNIVFKENATNGELQSAIEAAIPAAIVQTKQIAKQFKGRTELESCKKIFDFLRTKIRYKVDGENQKIKLPSALLRTRVGDCKSYAVFTAAILSNLKIPYYLTYSSYTRGVTEPGHIYVTTKSGCIIDAVFGKFNAEKKPFHKFNRSINGSNPFLLK